MDSKQVTPSLGMGLTLQMYTDRHAYTITYVSPSGKTIKARKDIATRIDSNGMSDSQDYSYTADPNGEELTVRLNKQGKWKSNRGYCALDCRRAYHNYSF